MKSIAKTHIGNVRKENQDIIFQNLDGFSTLPNLFIVADGMGGHSAGEVASKWALEAFLSFLQDESNACLSENPPDFLSKALSYANAQVHEKSLADLEHAGMGTTFTAATILDEQLHYAHVGDSRIYLATKKDGITQLTRDHSNQTEDLLEKGVITEKEAASYPDTLLNRAIGTDSYVDIDKASASLKDIEYILICSDGLTNMLSNQEILDTIQLENNLEDIAEQLVKKALEYGGYDNISLIIIDLTKGCEV